ncbi:MAG: hypothetical protein HY815_11340 [Candidatus Riflebacteria bacterium]|nr:hypothetical protein [Candidatus Riflebacteria bacterium]
MAAPTAITGYEIVADPALISGIKPLKPKFVANVGKPYSRTLLLEDVRRFQMLGTVGMVRAGEQSFKQGKKLLYRVEANPAIRSITLSGVSLFKPEEILKRFQTRPQQILDYNRLFADINAIPDYYMEKKGIMYADVTDLKDVAVRDGHVKIHVREFKMGDLVVKGVKGPEADLIRKSFKVKKGSVINRATLLASLHDIFQLSTVKDLDWYPRFDRERATVSMILQVTPVDESLPPKGRSRAD